MATILDRTMDMSQDNLSGSEVDDTGPQFPISKRKVVIVGDSKCGKSCLLQSWTSPEKDFCAVYVPTVFENSVTEVFLEKSGKMVELSLWDTSGHEDHERLRPYSYGSDTDVILLCYSIADPPSFLSIPSKWVPEVKHFCHRVPLVLVGLKKDLRHDPVTRKLLEDQNKYPILKSEGLSMAKRIDAVAFMECSSRRGDNIQALLVKVASLASKFGPKRRKKSCLLL